MKKHLLKMAQTAKAHSAWFGLPLVYIGVLLMVCFYAAGLTDSNALLLLPLALVVTGVAGYVLHEKHSANY